MTDTEQKALALDMAARAAGSSDWKSAEQCASPLARASMRAHAVTIEAHEADKKAFSDAVKHYLDQWRHSTPSREVFTCQFADFILPEPEPDPLVEAMSEAMCGIPGEDYAQPAKDLRAALAARGWKIERIEQ